MSPGDDSNEAFVVVDGEPDPSLIARLERLVVTLEGMSLEARETLAALRPSGLKREPAMRELPEGMVSGSDACRLSGASPKVLWSAVARGDLPARKIGRFLAIDRRVLTHWNALRRRRG